MTLIERCRERLEATETEIGYKREEIEEYISLLTKVEDESACRYIDCGIRTRTADLNKLLQRREKLRYIIRNYTDLESTGCIGIFEDADSVMIVYKDGFMDSVTF